MLLQVIQSVLSRTSLFLRQKRDISSKCINLGVLYSSWVSFLQPSQSHFSQTFKKILFSHYGQKENKSVFQSDCVLISEKRQHYGFHDHVNLPYQQAHSLFWQTERNRFPVGTAHLSPE